VRVAAQVDLVAMGLLPKEFGDVRSWGELGEWSALHAGARTQCRGPCEADAELTSLQAHSSLDAGARTQCGGPREADAELTSLQAHSWRRSCMKEQQEEQHEQQHNSGSKSGARCL
jgi:hypothetical protein